jgi:hypothetical protein
MRKSLPWLFAAFALLLAPAPQPVRAAAPRPAGPAQAPVLFAVIGDYGTTSAPAGDVARLVASWQPAFVVTTGDNYYRAAGGAGLEKYDRSTGAYYCAFLKGAAPGPACSGDEAERNNFYPTLGNHDYWEAGLAVHTGYFALPEPGVVSSSGNERFYDVARGPVHLFVLDSNPGEPAGVARDSAQARWLKAQLAASTAPWKLVFLHHPPYSSGLYHGSTPAVRWPFAEWGADAVFSGHDHDYERLMRDGIVYFVNGMGGSAPFIFGPLLPGSAASYGLDWGAQRVVASENAITFEFISIDGVVRDSQTLLKPGPASEPNGSAPLHVADLDGAATGSRAGAWSATVTARIEDAAGTPAVGIMVVGRWNVGGTSNAACLTGTDGACTLTLTGLPGTQAGVAFAVTGIDSTLYRLDHLAAADPDGDSDGRSIRGPRP